MATAKRQVTRRSFLKGLAVAGAAPYVIPASALGAEGRPAPSNRIVMGFVGVGGQGTGDMRGFIGFPEVQAVAVCDTDKRQRDGAQGIINSKNGNADCKAYGDFRELVTRPDIDAVFCATPDHWHALVTVTAMKNGKDVYCEKPESLTIREGQIMRDTARRYGRVFSGGSQRVWDDYNRGHRVVWSGAIGKVQEVWVNVGGPSGETIEPAQPVPEGMDWDMWLGPAPWRPYNKAYHPFNWRNYKDFSGGGMTDWGAHGFGGATYMCQLHETGPVEIIPPDGKEYRQLTYKYANGIIMHRDGGSYGGLISVRGTDGEATDTGFRDKKQDVPNFFVPNYKGRGGIFGDFLQCVKTRERPFRDIAIAVRTLTVCHLGNIANWLKRPLKWDPVKEEIVGDPEAARWLDRPKRAPWTL
ncbi:MAG: Gfo/Idh/MocA family oxidoreductase [Planctomycetota bacterium]|nr:Gfo/Idh/MocA family oxidoreductase [Planctomycetota bacterium]